MPRASNLCKSWKRAKVASHGCRKLPGHRNKARPDTVAGPILATDGEPIARGEGRSGQRGEAPGEAARVPVAHPGGCADKPTLIPHDLSGDGQHCPNPILAKTKFGQINHFWPCF